MPGGESFDVPQNWRQALANQLSGDEVVLGFRPEAVHTNGIGQLHAEVYASDLHGAFNMMHLSLADEDETVVHVRSKRGAGHAIGDRVAFDLDPDMVRFFNPRGRSHCATGDGHYPGVMR